MKKFKTYQDPAYRFDFNRMTRRDLWAFLLLLVTAPRLAVAAWKNFHTAKPLADTLMVGYKGKTALDAGFFYAPYVPLQTVRAFDVNEFQPKVPFKTRYSMAVGAPQPHGFNLDYYRSIKL